MIEEGGELALTLTEWDDDGNAVPRRAGGRGVQAAELKVLVGINFYFMVLLKDLDTGGGKGHVCCPPPRVFLRLKLIKCLPNF